MTIKRITKTAYARDTEELRKIRNIITSMGGFIVSSCFVGSLGYQITYTRDPR